MLKKFLNIYKNAYLYILILLIVLVFMCRFLQVGNEIALHYVSLSKGQFINYQLIEVQNTADLLYQAFRIRANDICCLSLFIGVVLCIVYSFIFRNAHIALNRENSADKNKQNNEASCWSNQDYIVCFWIAIIASGIYIGGLFLNESEPYRSGTLLHFIHTEHYPILQDSKRNLYGTIEQEYNPYLSINPALLWPQLNLDKQGSYTLSKNQYIRCDGEQSSKPNFVTCDRSPKESKMRFSYRTSLRNLEWTKVKDERNNVQHITGAEIKNNENSVHLIQEVEGLLFLVAIFLISPLPYQYPKDY